MLRVILATWLCVATVSAQMHWVQGSAFPFGHQAVSCYDSARDRVVLWWFGTHEFDGQSWTTIPTAVYPGQVSAAAYDSSRGVSVMHDFGSPSVWEWDGAAWTVIPQSVPSGLIAGMCFHGGRARVVELASYSQGVSADELWEWDGVQWSLAPAGAFPARAGGVGGMIYDEAWDKLVCYGWHSGGLVVFQPETWEWDANSGWVQVASGGPTTSGHTMVFDKARNRQVLVVRTVLGGGETWERTGSGPWVQVSVAQQGWGQRALYDETRRRSVFFETVSGQSWHWQPVHPTHYDLHGAGCPGTLSTPALSLAAPWTLPRIGDTLQVTLSELPVSLGGLVMGFSDLGFGGAPLPNHLAWIGMPGCYLRVAPEASVFLVGQNQAAQFALPIPNDNGLLGLRFFQQGLSFDPGANSIGVTMTNSMQGTIGSW